jgi:hypothetical protein
MKLQHEINNSPLLTFDARLGQARKQRQNLVLIKWLMVAITVTLLLIYLLTPIRFLLCH